jgi:guanylate kinase
MPFSPASSRGRRAEPGELVKALQGRRGLGIVISAPSGAGKTTVSKLLLEEMPELRLSVSLTTRPPRQEERDGIDYHFVSHEKFQQELKRGALLEWAQVHGRFYGTPRRFLEERIERGEDTILDIDVQGGFSVKQALHEAVLIFLLPPSLEELERRLRSRGADSAEDIEVRLQNALTEIDQYDFYDYLVVNDEAKEAMQMVKSVILSERHRISRLRR